MNPKRALFEIFLYYGESHMKWLGYLHEDMEKGYNSSFIFDWTRLINFLTYRIKH